MSEPICWGIIISRLIYVRTLLDQSGERTDTGRSEVQFNVNNLFTRNDDTAGKEDNSINVYKWQMMKKKTDERAVFALA